MLDKTKQLKFDDDTKTKVTIKSMGMEENDFGSQYVVHIEETNKCDHFKPSDGLKKKIVELNISEGDIIVIEKVGRSDKYQYGYFNVEMADNPVKTVDPAVHDHPMGAGFAQKDNKIDLHELSLRTETLEKKMNILMTWYGEKTGDAGHKPGDDNLPF